MQLTSVKVPRYVAHSETLPTDGYAQVVAGRHCLMIDDLCDSGLTLQSVRDRLLEAGAASVKSVVLLDKKARRKVGVIVAIYTG